MELLENAGYAVRAYSKAEELLARDAALEPGCIVSDVRMPGIDGLTLLRRLRTSGSTLPLMLITGGGVSMAVRQAAFSEDSDWAEWRTTLLDFRPTVRLAGVTAFAWQVI